MIHVSFDPKTIVSYCYLSCSKIHTEFCDPYNVKQQSVAKLDDVFCSPTEIGNKNILIDNWICTGIYQESIDQKCSRNGKWIAKFNPCLSILVIQINMQNHTVSALCDSGASKSLLSSHLYNILFSCNILQDTRINHQIKLIDVNNKLLKIMAVKNISFAIGTIFFSQDFIIFDSPRNQLLLGIDFFRQNNIAIYPSKGLAYENDIINNVQSVILPKYEACLKNDITLMVGGQQTATFFIKMSVNDIKSLSIINHFLLFSSEMLEPDSSFSELTIVHQYVKINAYLEFDAVITNQSSDIKYFAKNQTVGHLEHVSVINDVQSIFDDDLSLCLMVYLSQLEENSLQIQEDRLFNDLTSENNFQISDINCSSSDPRDLLWLKEIHYKYHKMFSAHDWSVGDKTGSSVPITVRTNATVCRQKTNKINPKIKERADEIIGTLLERKLIAISKSPWNSRVLFVEKQPDNVHITANKGIAGQKENPANQRKLRLVVDYRFLNTRIKEINTSWPSPTVFDMLNTLHEARYISTMDITQGFFHFRLNKDARKYTAFSWNSTVYEFLRLPQGLKISSAIMQSKMCQFVRKYKLLGTEIYIDNLILHSTSKEEYKKRLEELFSACVQAGIKCKIKKCFHFISEQFILFGFKIDLRLHSIQPEFDKISAICDLLPPHSKKSAKSFIGSLNYFCTLIPNLQQILSPIHEAASPNRKTFVWTDACQSAFEKSKSLLAKIPLIYLINPSLPFHASTDALAGVSIAYTLWQHHNQLNQLVPVKFNSHKLSASEKNLSQYETEGLAIVYCLSKEQEILSFGNLILYTDCRSLTFINRYANSCSKLSRWDIFVRSFNMIIHFLPNTDGRIKICDLLTRNNVHKAQFKNKLSKTDLDKFQQFNFEGLPDMEIQDVMKIIQNLNDLIDKQVLSQQIIANVQQLFYTLPTHTFRNNHNHCLVRPELSPHILLVTKMEYQEDKISLPITPSLTLSDIDWDSQEICNIRIKELLANYLNNMSIQNLISLQQQEKWILNAQKRHNFFITEGLLFRATQLSNGVKISQLVLPDKLSFDLIKIFHNKPFVMHNSVNKMQRHLAQIFYIRNFNIIAKQVIDNCRFCLLNKSYPTKAVPKGQQILIEKPGQAISIDICSVRSDSVIDAFLCIVDNFSKFVTLVPISRNCTSQDVVTALMTFWVQTQGFPLAIVSDGAKNMISTLMGEAAAIMNVKLYRISAGNSQSNLAERFNLLTIQSLRIFDQSYGITDQNFPVILSMVANMLNYMPNVTGYTPYYLQLGRKPRLHPFISFRNLSICQNLDSHAKSLIQAQNVCHILFQASQQAQQKNASKHSFKVGDFCLLRKLQVQGPKHGAKLRPVYYTEPFRIVRLYRTNAMVVPFNRKIMKARIKGEGAITKNMATIARLNRLKPLKNPNLLLHLSINDKILRKFNTILQSPIIQSEILQPVQNHSKEPSRLFKQINPSIIINNKEPIKVQDQNISPSVVDICPILMHPLVPGQSSARITSGASNDENTSVKSSYFWKLVPKNKCNKKLPSSTITSLTVKSDLSPTNNDNDVINISQNNLNQSVSNNSSSIVLQSEYSASSNHTVIQLSSSPRISLHDHSDDDYNFLDEEHNLSHTIHPVDNEEIQNIEDNQTLRLQNPTEDTVIRDFATVSTPRAPQQDAIETSRPRSVKSVRTRISLTSGKSLVLQLNPSSESTIKDAKK